MTANVYGKHSRSAQGKFNISQRHCTAWTDFCMCSKMRDLIIFASAYTLENSWRENFEVKCKICILSLHMNVSQWTSKMPSNVFACMIRLAKVKDHLFAVKLDTFTILENVYELQDRWKTRVLSPDKRYIDSVVAIWHFLRRQFFAVLDCFRNYKFYYKSPCEIITLFYGA